jgi:hypothetical protein
MTAEPATYPAMFVLQGGSPRRPDPVRARISAGQQIIYSQALPLDPAETTHSRPHLPDTRNGGPRRPHPGDVLYWVACLGGACLLLLSATT